MQLATVLVPNRRVKGGHLVEFYAEDVFYAGFCLAYVLFYFIFGRIPAILLFELLDIFVNFPL